MSEAPIQGCLRVRCAVKEPVVKGVDMSWMKAFE